MGVFSAWEHIRDDAFAAVVARSEAARRRRAETFLRLLRPREGDRILDLGGADGEHIAAIVPFRRGVVVADIDPEVLERARERFGFETLLLDETGVIPADDASFDIVFCSSVIEHVTVPKDEILTCRDGRAFNRAAWERQAQFAAEIRRIARGYFVQTPWRYFLVECHTMLPLPFVLLPRSAQIRLILWFNRWWIKTTLPDWRLFTVREMRRLFPEAAIIRERWFGLTKSLMAVKSPPGR